MTTNEQPNLRSHSHPGVANSTGRRHCGLISADQVATAVRRGLERAGWPYERHGRKRLMQITGMSKSASDYRLRGCRSPGAPELVALMQIDEVAIEIMGLIGRNDLISRRAILHRIRELRALAEEVERHLPPAEEGINDDGQARQEGSATT